MWVRDDFGEHGTETDHANQPPYLEIAHTYDRSSSRLTYNDNRHGAKLPGRNRSFQYDRLNRLTQEVRTPTVSGSTYTPQHKSLRWNLDTLGNWSSVDTDLDLDGNFDSGGDLDRELVRQHNMANEIESGLQYDSRIYESAVHSTYKDRLYDDNGNMTDERGAPALPGPGDEFPGQLHTYDAWNRLVKSEYINGSGTSIADISVNTYNALGWRTSRAFDDSQSAYSGLEQKRVYSYGASWRMLEERIDTDVSTNSDSAGGTDDDTDWIGQQFWGLRYIDDAVGKRVDRAGDGDFLDATDCTYWYQLTDTQFSVCAVLDQYGFVYERISYDAYGQANHRYGGNANGDTVVSSADVGLNGGDNDIADTNYHADLDLNCDGEFTSADSDAILAYTPFVPFAYQGLPSGWISDPSSSDGPDNSIGYAGYVYNHEREDYTVRFRNYNPELGRWMQRDPIGYLAGQNSLYEYISSAPMTWLDAMGLEKVDCDEVLEDIDRKSRQFENLYNYFHGDSSSGSGSSAPGEVPGANPEDFARAPVDVSRGVAQSVAEAEYGKGSAAIRPLRALGPATTVGDAAITYVQTGSATESGLTLANGIVSAKAATLAGAKIGGVKGAVVGAVVGVGVSAGYEIGRRAVVPLIDRAADAIARSQQNSYNNANDRRKHKAMGRIHDDLRELGDIYQECCMGK